MPPPVNRPAAVRVAAAPPLSIAELAVAALEAATPVLAAVAAIEPKERFGVPVRRLWATPGA